MHDPLAPVWEKGCESEWKISQGLAASTEIPGMFLPVPGDVLIGEIQRLYPGNQIPHSRVCKGLMPIDGKNMGEYLAEAFFRIGFQNWRIFKPVVYIGTS